MNEVNSVRPPSSSEDEVRLSHLFAALLRNARSILLTTLLLAAAILVIHLLSPNRYDAVTVLVPAHSRGSELSLLATQLGMPFPIGDRDDSGRLLGAFVSSRVMADSIVRRLLPSSPRPKEEGQIRKVLAKSTELRKNADGSLVLVVNDRDRHRAAKIANELPLLLNQISTAVGAEVTQRKEAYLVEQLNDALGQLAESERRLVEFRRTGAAPVIQAQAEQTVEAAAAVQRAVMEQEVKIAQMRRTMTPSNPELQAALAELGARRGQLHQLTGVGSISGGQAYVPMREAPGIAATEARLVREYEGKAEIYGMLAAAIAQARIDMNNNLPVVSVLDSALVPTQPARLPLPAVIAIGLLVGLFAGVARAAWNEYWLKLNRDPEGRVLPEAWAAAKRDAWRLVGRKA